MNAFCIRDSTLSSQAMQRRVLASIKLISVRQFSAASKASTEAPLGFIGLGHMGGKMVENLSKDGRKVLVFDASTEAIQKVVAASAAGNKSVSQASMEEIAQKCSVIFSMLPNDQVRSNYSHSFFINNIMIVLFCVCRS